MTEKVFSDGLDLTKSSMERFLEAANYKSSWFFIDTENRTDTKLNKEFLTNAELIDVKPIVSSKYTAIAVFRIDKEVNGVPYDFKNRNRYLTRRVKIKQIKANDLIREFGINGVIYLGEQKISKTTELATILSKHFGLTIEEKDILEQTVPENCQCVLVVFNSRSLNYTGSMRVDISTQVIGGKKTKPTLGTVPTTSSEYNGKFLLTFGTKQIGYFEKVTDMVDSFRANNFLADKISDDEILVTNKSKKDNPFSIIKVGGTMAKKLGHVTTTIVRDGAIVVNNAAVKQASETSFAINDGQYKVTVAGSVFEVKSLAELQSKITESGFSSKVAVDYNLDSGIFKIFNLQSATLVEFKIENTSGDKLEVRYNANSNGSFGLGNGLLHGYLVATEAGASEDNKPTNNNSNTGNTNNSDSQTGKDTSGSTDTSGTGGQTDTGNTDDGATNSGEDTSTSTPSDSGTTTTTNPPAPPKYTVSYTVNSETTNRVFDNVDAVKDYLLALGYVMTDTENKYLVGGTSDVITSLEVRSEGASGFDLVNGNNIITIAKDNENKIAGNVRVDGIKIERSKTRAVSINTVRGGNYTAEYNGVRIFTTRDNGDEMVPAIADVGEHEYFIEGNKLFVTIADNNPGVLVIKSDNPIEPTSVDTDRTNKYLVENKTVMVVFPKLEDKTPAPPVDDEDKKPDPKDPGSPVVIDTPTEGTKPVDNTGSDTGKDDQDNGETTGEEDPVVTPPPPPAPIDEPKSTGKLNDSDNQYASLNEALDDIRKLGFVVDSFNNGEQIVISKPIHDGLGATYRESTLPVAVQPTPVKYTYGTGLSANQDNAGEFFDLNPDPMVYERLTDNIQVAFVSGAIDILVDDTVIFNNFQPKDIAVATEIQLPGFKLTNAGLNSDNVPTFRLTNISDRNQLVRLVPSTETGAEISPVYVGDEWVYPSTMGIIHALLKPEVKAVELPPAEGEDPVVIPPPPPPPAPIDEPKSTGKLNNGEKQYKSVDEAIGDIKALGYVVDQTPNGDSFLITKVNPDLVDVQYVEGTLTDSPMPDAVTDTYGTWAYKDQDTAGTFFKLTPPPVIYERLTQTVPVELISGSVDIVVDDKVIYSNLNANNIDDAIRTFSAEGFKLTKFTAKPTDNPAVLLTNTGTTTKLARFVPSPGDDNDVYIRVVHHQENYELIQTPFPSTMQLVHALLKPEPKAVVLGPEEGEDPVISDDPPPAPPAPRDPPPAALPRYSGYVEMKDGSRHQTYAEDISELQHFFRPHGVILETDNFVIISSHLDDNIQRYGVDDLEMSRPAEEYTATDNTTVAFPLNLLNFTVTNSAELSSANRLYNFKLAEGEYAVGRNGEEVYYGDLSGVENYLNTIGAYGHMPDGIWLFTADKPEDGKPFVLTITRYDENPSFTFVQDPSVNVNVKHMGTLLHAVFDVKEDVPIVVLPKPEGEVLDNPPVNPPYEPDTMEPPVSQPVAPDTMVPPPPVDVFDPDTIQPPTGGESGAPVAIVLDLPEGETHSDPEPFLGSRSDPAPVDLTARLFINGEPVLFNPSFQEVANKLTEYGMMVTTNRGRMMISNYSGQPYSIKYTNPLATLPAVSAQGTNKVLWEGNLDQGLPEADFNLTVGTGFAMAAIRLEQDGRYEMYNGTESLGILTPNEIPAKLEAIGIETTIYPDYFEIYSTSAVQEYIYLRLRARHSDSAVVEIPEENTYNDTALTLGPWYQVVITPGGIGD